MYIPSWQHVDIYNVLFGMVMNWSSKCLLVSCKANSFGMC